MRQSNGFGIFVRRDLNGGRSYWIYDRNGSEREMHLKETDEQIDNDGFDDNSVAYDKQMVNRFDNYMHQLMRPGIKVVPVWEFPKMTSREFPGISGKTRAGNGKKHIEIFAPKLQRHF